MPQKQKPRGRRDRLGENMITISPENGFSFPDGTGFAHFPSRVLGTHSDTLDTHVLRVDRGRVVPDLHDELLAVGVDGPHFHEDS